MGRFLLRAAAVVVLLLAATAAYLLFWPVPAEPVAWNAPVPPGYVGPHAANTRLANLRMIDLGGEVGPEHIVAGPDGKIYAAVEGGKILRMDPDGGKQEIYANTGGRILGFAFDAQGRLIAADAIKGLLSRRRRGDAAGRRRNDFRRRCRANRARSHLHPAQHQGAA